MTVSETLTIEESYFEHSHNISMDIETEGFAGGNGDQITVIGLHPDNKTYDETNEDEYKDPTIMLVNIKDKDVSQETIINNLEQYGVDTKIKFFTSEFDLLDTGLRAVVNKLTKDHHRLYGYNAETWGGGFDIPFIRTRFIKNDIEWFLDGIYFVDFLNEIRKHINTVEPVLSELSEDNREQFKERFDLTEKDLVTNNYSKDKLEVFGDEQNIDVFTSSNGLDEAHDVLCGCDVEDPFDSSEEAVTCYNNNEIADVVYHCYTDIVRTKHLFDIVMEYTPAREPHELKDSGFL